MFKASTLYVPNILSSESIEPDERYQQIAKNLSGYGIKVMNNRHPVDIIANHKTISGISGDYCSAMGSRNETLFDPHQVEESSVYISLLVHGQQLITGRKKSVSAQVNPGMLIVHQRNDYYHYQCEAAKHLYIIPNTDKVKTLFSGKLTNPIVSLENHPLALFLKSHMRLLDEQSGCLSPQKTAAIVDSLHHISLLVLADVAEEKGLRSYGKLSHIVNSARSFIILNYNQHQLSPDLICLTLRCSRASLDRAFNEHGTTVMAVIKDIRLEAARELLENNPLLPVERVSWLCGFVSHPLFSKNFREKYHASPKVWRDNHRL